MENLKKLKGTRILIQEELKFLDAINEFSGSVGPFSSNVSTMPVQMGFVEDYLYFVNLSVENTIQYLSNRKLLLRKSDTYKKIMRQIENKKKKIKLDLIVPTCYVVPHFSNF